MDDAGTIPDDAGGGSADRDRIVGVLYAYADALDRRDWPALTDVFSPGVRAEYGGTEHTDGRAELVAMIRGYLDSCGPTQHLMGNPRATVAGDSATASVKMRVHHAAAADPSTTYECFGWYHARLEHTDAGWRIVRWRQEVTHELGTHEVFGRG
ncbi:nuclear transport factor 2 family protein [Tomitella gaofuii]|uniref:nuclear transport factor 2 family protein n=1 Tax=Tomitella gaofuii TaxID=2760083 RepID=UPI0015F84403|nr:nuclear transport factor 2 family protein [Tomitella gaofuii]